jgi:hypothetical protein
LVIESLLSSSLTASVIAIYSPFTSKGLSKQVSAKNVGESRN